MPAVTPPAEGGTVPTLTCDRCARRVVWGVLSSQAWLAHRDGNEQVLHLCPTCSGELTEDQRQTFLSSGVHDRTDG